MAFASGKKVNVFPADEYQEGPQPIPMEDGVDYYVTIPAGIVKNAEGSLNQKIVLHFVGKIKRRRPDEKVTTALLQITTVRSMSY